MEILEIKQAGGEVRRTLEVYFSYLESKNTHKHANGIIWELQNKSFSSEYLFTSEIGLGRAKYLVVGGF